MAKEKPNKLFKFFVCHDSVVVWIEELDEEIYELVVGGVVVVKKFVKLEERLPVNFLKGVVYVDPQCV